MICSASWQRTARFELRKAPLNDVAQRGKAGCILGSWPRVWTPALPLFVFGHLAPLLRNFEELFLDKGIARLFGEFFALSCLGAILFCLGRHSPSPRSSGR